MSIYSNEEIILLKNDFRILKQEQEAYCLVPLNKNMNITEKEMDIHINFCIRQAIEALSANYISEEELIRIFEILETYKFSADMLGYRKVVIKINIEIMQQVFEIENFNALCVECEDYDNYKRRNI